MRTVLSRRWMLRVVALSVGLPALGGQPGPARALAQTDQTAADSDLLFSAVVEDLPAPPAVVRLGRITLDAGAELPQQSFEGPAFGLVERGVLSLRVEGEAVVSLAERDGAPAEARVPDPREPVDLRSPDQVAIPAGVPFTLANPGEEEASFLAALVLPATGDGSGIGPPGAGTAVPGPNGETTFDVLGEAVASGWPAAPFLVQLDRVAVGPGEPVPGFPGPVLQTVERGAFGFALVDGEIQAAASDPGTPIAGDGDAVYRIGEGEAIFFAGGVNALPRGEDEPELVLLRFGVASLPEDGDATSAAATPGDEGAPAAAAAGTSSDVATRNVDAIGAGPNGDDRGRISADGVRLRSSPSTGGAVVAELAQGIEVIVTGDPVEAEGLRWLPVRVADDSETAGYVAEQFVEPIA